MSETQDLFESTGTRPVIGGTVGHSTLVSNKQWIVIQASWLQQQKAGKLCFCFFNKTSILLVTNVASF